MYGAFPTQVWKQCHNGTTKLHGLVTEHEVLKVQVQHIGHFLLSSVG